MTEAAVADRSPSQSKLELDDAAGTRQPFDFSDEMSARVKELGLRDAVDHLRREGYAIIDSGMPVELTARLRETCLRMAQETEGKAKGRSAALLLGRDPIYQEVVLNSRILALAEIMCGKGALLSQLICSIRPQGSPEIGLHADQNCLPAPFPVHNQLLTLCWACDEFTRAGGCTKVIPRTHLARRHPTAKEREEQTGAIRTECPAGSIVVWDGSIWHANYPREAGGERVVLHITFGRLALRTVENYDHLDEAWLEGRPEELRVMLGRADFLGTTTIARGHADYTNLQRTFDWAKT